MSFDNKMIISKLEQIQKKLERETDKLIVDTEKFQLEITKSVVDYSSNLMKEKISKVLEEEIEKFKFIKIIIDYSLVIQQENLDKILKGIEQAKKDIVPSEFISSINQNIDDFTKRIVLDFPYQLGTSIIDKFERRFSVILKESKIGS
ncbi:MAG: hypothetical protein EAX96_02490 [Candidatus Lokiarchaeota archaeon]|nr:hypothetical protein [Candidatus Lokiarchaeota archaeon]